MQVAADNVFQLWTLPDMDNVLSFIKKHSPRRAVIIGAGFVGLEVLEQLQRIGMHVELVERAPHVLAPLDSEMAQMVEQEMTKAGVPLHLGAAIEKLDIENGRAQAVVLSDGQRIEADLVMVGAGVRPRTELAQAAGLTIGKSGGVSVNKFMQTSDPNIYAVGDMIEVEHGVLPHPVRIPLAGPANRAGRIAGAHAASGSSQPMGKTLGTAIVRVFEIVAAATASTNAPARPKGSLIMWPRFKPLIMQATIRVRKNSRSS